MVRAGDYFTPEQIERARRYHRPLYRLLFISFIVDFAVLALLAFGPPGDWIGEGIAGLPFWAQTLAVPAVVLVVLWLIGFPISFWLGYVHEKQWGLSTQDSRGWLVDRLKGLGIDVVLTSGVLCGFIALAHMFPNVWPAILAPSAAVVVLFLSFLAPIVLEPLFNKFEPLADLTMAADLRALGDRAGVPLCDVLVADASRRTRKENAYVSGFGKTRRLVVYDTLLGRARPAEVRVVVAHELGHRRMRHVILSTMMGMIGASGVVVLVWALLEAPSILRATGASGPSDPRVIPFILLVAATLQALVMPAAAALSRRWESAADRFSLNLTGDAEAFEEMFRALAISNVSDLDPPRAVYVMAFTHPTPAMRIAAGRRWSAEHNEIT